MIHALHGGTNVNGPTYPHRELQKMFVETKDMNDGKMERARVYMETHPSTHLVPPCRSAVDEQKLVVNDPTPTTPLTFVNAVRRSNPIHIVQLAYHFGVRFESAPLIGVGSFFVVTHGYGVVVFFEIGDICDYGHSLEGFTEYVTDLSAGAWKTKALSGSVAPAPCLDATSG